MDSDDDTHYYSDGDNSYGDDPTFDDQIAPKISQNYTVLGESDIRRRQADTVATVAAVLSVSESVASILLRHYRWSPGSVHEAWFTDEDAARKFTGLVMPKNVKKDGILITCGICLESCPVGDVASALCGHLFCNVCWRQYVATSIEGGSGCLTLQCPEPSCMAAVGRDMIDHLAYDADKIKYDNYLVRSYVEGNKKIKWCPAPGCVYAVEFDGGGGGGYDVMCFCGHGFCWNCTEEAHRPVDCDTVAKWILKNSAEAENVTWILAYTKPCPKCKRPIEKNKGCMHMTCNSACRFQFCWLCLGDWNGHDSHNRCNGYEEANSEAGPETETEKRRKLAKKSIEKYTHYYERWAANHSSRQKALWDLRNLETVKLEKLSKNQGLPITELEFVTEALVQIIECRRVLKWTYAYGYYLPEKEGAKKQFFEYLQGEAEDGLERLHHCAEKELGDYLDAKTPSDAFSDFRMKLTGLTSITRSYFENLVKALENGLPDVDSGGGCSVTEHDKKKRARGKDQINNTRALKR